MTDLPENPRILKMLEYGRGLLADDEVLEWGGTIRIYRREDAPGEAVNPYTPGTSHRHTYSNHRQGGATYRCAEPCDPGSHGKARVDRKPYECECGGLARSDIPWDGSEYPWVCDRCGKTLPIPVWASTVPLGQSSESTAD